MQRRASRIRTGLAAVAFAWAALGCASLRASSADPAPVPILAIAFDAAEAEAGPDGFAARVHVDGAEGRARVRVAGGASALGAGGRPRIDVELRGEDRLLGMRRFSLRDPSELEFERTSAVYDRLRAAGVLAPRTRPVRVTANEASLGTMVVVEDCSKELVESQRRREGVLFRLRAASLPVAEVDPYGGKKVERDERLAVERDTAAGLLQAFLLGRLPAGQVFDETLMARFLVIAEREGAEGLLDPRALRFYFNPVTQRIEPLAVDERLGAGSASPDGAAAWSAQLLADPGLRAAWQAERARRAGASAEAPGAGADGEGTRPAPALLPSPTQAARSANPIPTARREEALARHPFLAWDSEAHRLRAGPGTWTVRGSLVLPEGVGLDLDAGTTLRFAPGEVLVATGPLRFRGTPERPVVLEGLDGGDWAGLVVLSSGEAHEWSHVRVRGTSGIDRDGWQLTGGVTFRESELRASDAVFSHNRAEDALNLIRSRFLLHGLVVEQTTSDGFDCDFCEGRLEGGAFRGIGGDGLDVSGSVVEADGVRFEDVVDKAVSVGEASRVTVRRARIERVGTGVAAKDGSEVLFEASAVTDAGFAGVAAYVKKAEYGPGRVVARGIRMERVARPVLVQHGSRVEWDGVEQPTQALDVEALYEGGAMAK